MLCTNSFKRRNASPRYFCPDAKLLRLDDGHAVFGDALVIELQQTLFKFPAAATRR